MKPHLAIFLCLAGLPVGAQKPVVLHSQTNVVLVDVVVTDKKGAYVQGLAAKDFKVFEDGKEQTIQGVSLESAAAPGAAPRTDYMVVAFDFGGIANAGDQIKARQAARRFIDANASANHLMAVMNYYSGGLQILQGFTSDAGRLKDAVESAKAGTINAAAAPSERSRGIQPANDTSGRSPVLVVKALTDFVASLRTAPGRKAVILFTGDLTVPNSQRSLTSDLIQAANRANVGLYPVSVRDASPQGLDASSDGAGASGGGGGRRGGRGRGGSVDPDDPLPGADPYSENQEFLSSLANGTGGFLVTSSSDLPRGMQKIGEEQDQSYVIGYAAPESQPDACHRLKVKVDRGGTTVRARADYCSGKTQEVAVVSAATRELEKRAAASPAPNIPASLALPFFYVRPGVARVHAVLEIQPNAIKLEKQKDRLHADINVLGIASTSGGETGARFADSMAIDISESDFEKWKTMPLHYEKQFEVAPGAYTFTLVFSAGGESFGKLEEPLAVEPYQAGQFAISGLALSKEVRKAAPNQPGLGALFSDRTPLVSSGMELIPDGSKVFTKTDHAYSYFEVYGLSAADKPVLTVRILDEKDKPMWSSGTMTLSAPAGNSTTLPLALSLAIAELPPDSYQLEVTAVKVTAAVGTNSVHRRTAFVVK